MGCGCLKIGITKNMKKKTKIKPIQSLVVQQVQLTQEQTAMIQARTPQEFIKSRPTRGGKAARYVEGGYVISQLNTIFKPVNWDFEILEQNIDKELGTVWVRGKLTVIDHKNNYRVSKTQYGQHDIAKGVPLGDTLKAAATDCMKKCATMFGIALDVYWGQMDEEVKTPKNAVQKKEEKKETEKEVYEKAKKMILAAKNSSMLIQFCERVQSGESKTYTKEHAEELVALAIAQVDKLDNPQ